MNKIMFNLFYHRFEKLGFQMCISFRICYSNVQFYFSPLSKDSILRKSDHDIEVRSLSFEPFSLHLYLDQNNSFYKI
jgi:hypothetical protein